MQIAKKISFSGLLVGLMIAITGCTTVISNTSTSVKVVTGGDRRSKGTIVDDNTLKLTIFNDIKKRYGSGTHVNVNTYDGRVLLTGEVETAEIRQAIETNATQTAGVRIVNNDIVVGWPTGAFRRSADGIITTKIIVVTENGVVYLMGRVTQQERQIASGIAANVNGVKRVVTLFDTLSEEELAKLNGKKS
jgi:osmotically-inducible protein OsmY